ncbi:SDR family NAD(P)-dependent oxidoreductase [Arthrobacter sp. FW306-2-2C-D06B]|uniref:SDR family NAD(P)-dependent oxidoreductase n=1 Tax=Arthrobacter sp. FW306-2-2C-D06B TaxID=2879618 RepID=UPI001F2FD87B|nr:SDR family oxidoreductase [Arthrobacter sp. FW306-2-2C-D06B]UKA60423.1 SDR family oxidoreductase [Arthrobacter sp. FW306-2-2C-D06B]
MGRLIGKTAIISGAATGIGAETARRFVAEGASVAILDVNVDQGQALAEELAGDNGAARFFACDVSDPAAVRTAVDAAAEAFGGLNIVFANAGIGTLHIGGTVESIETERWDLAFDVNTRGVYALAGAAVPHLREQGGGSIILTASIYAFVGTSGRPTHAYAATKGAVVALARAMAATYGPEGIRVNAIAPGAIRTHLNDDVASNPELLAQWVEGIPLRRLGTTKELASSALFLASDDSSFVTGSVLVVDGGQIAV